MKNKCTIGVPVDAKIMISVHTGETYLWVTASNKDGSSINFTHEVKSFNRIEKDIVGFMNEIESEILEYVLPRADYVVANFTVEYRYDGSEARIKCRRR